VIATPAVVVIRLDNSELVAEFLLLQLVFENDNKFLLQLSFLINLIYDFNLSNYAHTELKCRLENVHLISTVIMGHCKYVTKCSFGVNNDMSHYRRLILLYIV